MTPVYKLSANSVKNGRTVYGSMLAGNTAFNPSSFESIATVSLSSAASDVTFSSIPSTYSHLQIRAIFRNTQFSGGGAEQYLCLQCNSDTGTNYSYHYLLGNGGGAFSGAASSATYMQFEYPIPMSNDLANVFGAGVIDILDYKNTNKYKTARVLAGVDCNGASTKNVILASGLWQNTSAITSIKVFPREDQFATYSHFALYGIKEA